MNNIILRAVTYARHNFVPAKIKKKYNVYLERKKYFTAMKMNENDYESYLCNRYEEMMNRISITKGLHMDFDNPVTYTQKQQWLKLYDQSPIKTRLSDKYAVRSYISDTIGERYLIPLIQIDGKDRFFNAEEINFDALPNRFVIKCNHGSHYNIIVNDKNKLTKRNIREIKRQLNKWLQERYAFVVGLELVYEQIKPCIIIEQYMAIDEDLPDYKFMCFSGEVKYVWCDQGRFSDHRRSVFDINYQSAPFNLYIHEDIKNKDKPDNYDEMVDIAKKLCGEFIYVRVDLYNVKGRVYFGELTFCSGSGYQAPRPIEYDAVLGNLIHIDQTKRSNNYQYRHRL